MSDLTSALQRISTAAAADPRSSLALAKQTGMSPNTVTKIRSGAYMPKTIENLIAVERALGLAVADPNPADEVAQAHHHNRISHTTKEARP